MIIKEIPIEFAEVLEALESYMKASISLYTWCKLSTPIWAFIQTYVCRLGSSQLSAFIQTINTAVPDFYLNKVEAGLLN